MDRAYRTVLAWRSMGAPERTAAGVSRPGSEPSMTLLGMGEKELPNVSTLAPTNAFVLSPKWFLRDSIVGSHVVVGLVSLAHSRGLLGDHLSIAVGGCGRMLGVGRRTALLASQSHAWVVSHGLATDEGGRALRQRRAGGRTQRRGCESLKGRHGGWARVLL